jgi:hypothetical protein
MAALLRYLTSKQNLDDKREINLANEFRTRLEHVEGELKTCLHQHRECNDRVRKLEVAHEARQQNDSLHQQLLVELRAIASEAVSGRRDAIDELKAFFAKPP